MVRATLQLLAYAIFLHVAASSNVSQLAYLKPSTISYGYFGSAVSVSGNTFVVGAWQEDRCATGINGNCIEAGAAYVFVRNEQTGQWFQQAYLKPTNTGSGDRFGSAVSVSGNTLVVGAYFEDSCATGINGNGADNSCGDAGAAYVFVRNEQTGQWFQQAYLKPTNTGSGDYFGHAVSVSGNTLVVGADREDSCATGINGNEADNTCYDAGAAYVFVRNEQTGQWFQQAYLKPTNTGSGDNFGFAVSVSGNTFVVGAWQEDSCATGINGNGADNGCGEAGAAYVFVRNEQTGQWFQQAYLKPTNTGSYDYFGLAVSVSGNTLVVGAYYEDSCATGINGNEADNSCDGAGAVYVFVRNEQTGQWFQQAYLKPTNTGSYDYFGIEVSVSGNTLVVGAVGEDSCATGINGNGADNSCDGEGAAYVFNISAEVACPAFSAGAGVLSGCTCIAGYQGHIQTSASWPYYVGACIKLDECLARPCMHGNCTELVGNYSCECESGWAGRNCSLNIDECAQKPVGPCAEGSRCLDTPGSFLCTVSPVFKAPLQVPAGTNLSRVPPGTTLRFEVQGSLWKVMVKNVSFGPVSRSTLQFQCANFTVDAGSRLVACILPSSFTGMQLHFAVRSCFPFNATGDGTDPGCHTFQWSPVQLILLPKTTPFLFAAPPPRLSPGTLRLYLTPAPGSTTLTLPSNLQFLVTFEGTAFTGNLSLLQVTYGPWTCQPTSDSTAERVVCQTELYSAGAYQFVVTVDGQLGQGTDTLIVPPGATLESLSGCRFTTDKSVNGKRLQGTSGCSTEGGTVLTLRGQDLVTGALVPQILVNSQLCRPLQIDGKAFEAGGLNLTQLLTCEMPAGTGAGAVSIFNGKAFSRLFPLVEYAVPFITKLEAPECIQASPLSLTDCPRQGFDLTIVGVAFGAESASVLVGRWECSDVRHGNGLEAHSRLQCRVPPGSGQSLSVRVEQHDGFRSQGEPGFVSTKECEPPFHLPSDSLECAVCPPGTEAPAVGSRSCKPCPENTWRNQPNQMQCEVCQLGKISADGLSCICPAKLFESRGPGLLCLPCLAGAICEHPGTNASNMLAREGWFKLDQLLLDTDANMDPDFYMCPGGASVCLAANKCAPTLTGPFCTQCQPGLYSWGSLSCGPCRAWRLYLALALAGLLLYALFLRVVSESASGSGVIKIIFFFIATAQEMLGPRYRWLSWLAFLNFEAQSSTSEICFAPLSPTQRLAFNAFFPLLMFVLLLCIGLVEYWWKQRTQGRFVWATYSRTFCAVLLLSYSRVSKGVISYFDCDKIGPYFLITDHPAVDCSSEGYRKLRPFMLLLCLFPVALLPVCIGLYLLRHRAALGNPAPSAELSHAKEFFGPLFETYNASNFLFEPLAIFRRTLLITFAVVIDDPLERAEYLFMLQLACLSLQMYLHPFRTAQDNGLEAMCLLCLVSIAGLNTGLLDKEVLPFGVQVLVSLLVLGPICRALFLFSRAKFESWRLTRLDTDPASPRGSALDVLYSVTNLAALAGPSFLWKKSSASAAKVAAEGDVEIHTSPARRDKSGARESKEESAHEQPLGQSVADPYGEILAQDDAEDAVPLYEPQTDEQDEWSRNQPRNVESASSTNEQGG